MDSATWDQRYAVSELVWSAEANRWVIEELSDLPPGRALDLACGEGRTTLWLARKDWTVTGLEFSAVALDKARTVTEAEEPEVRARIRWLEQDLTTWRPRAGEADLVVIAYLHLPAPERRRVLQHAV